MASEDLFAEEFSEDIINDLDQDYAVEEIVGDQEEDNEESTEKIIESLEKSKEELKKDEELEEGILKEFEDNIEEPSAEAENTSNDTAKEKTKSAAPTGKLFQLPLARIKNLMKCDSDLHQASNEAVFVVAKATELFVESLAREAYAFTHQAKKKCVQRRDVDLAIDAVDSLMFLEGCMDFDKIKDIL